MTHSYPAVIAPDDNGQFTVTFRDLPGATFGATRAEALRHAVDLLESSLSWFIDAHRPLPRASRPRRGETLVTPTAIACAKLALHETMVARRLGRKTLARMLGWHPPQVARALDLAHDSRLDLIEQALAALGKRLVVDMKDAA